MKNIFLAALLSFSVFAQENDLGSPRKAQDFYTDDLKKAVETGLPVFNETVLSQRLRRIQAKYPNGAPGHNVNDFRTLQKHFGFPSQDLPPGQTYFEGPNYAYGLDKNEGKLFVHKNFETLAPLSVEQAKKDAPVADRVHRGWLTKLGVAADQLFFAEPGFMYLQSAPDPKQGPTTRVLPPVVDNIHLYGIRALDGLLVDGSSLRLASKNAQTLEGVDLSWPTVRFHPGLKEFAVRGKGELFNDVLRQVTNTTAKGDKVSVKMAVVLRPVQTTTGQVFIPALKVGVLSARNEGGNLFFVNLVKDPTPYVEIQSAEVAEGGN